MRVGTEAEVAEAVRAARGPLRIVGGGTRGIGACGGEVLEVSGLGGVRLYEPGALTLEAGAGTRVAEVAALLAGAGQRLAFEVPDLRGLLGRIGESTLGGVAAANASGPRRIQVGAARDHLLGLRFVDGRGAVIKNGGRVMKNVTGLDLVRLVAGSRGTLGVITEVAFKVQAIPEAEATLVSANMQAEAGLAALTQALGSPFDVSGAAFWQGEARIRLEGMAGSVDYRLAALRAILPGEFRVETGGESAALWREIRDVVPFAGTDAEVWRVVLRPSDATGFTRALGQAGLAHRALFDWGGGLIWIEMQRPAGQALRAVLAGFGGHATVIRGRSGPVFPPQSAAVTRLEAGLRAEFDPRGILNAGLMG